MKKYLLFITISCFAFAGLGAEEKKYNNELPEVFKKWLDQEVAYIISDLEREVFLQLKTNRERELFIEAFWKQRDPTPGTPENEFRVEHYRRIDYANQKFGRAAAKPGWMTDRGPTWSFSKKRGSESISSTALAEMALKPLCLPIWEVRAIISQPTKF